MALYPVRTVAPVSSTGQTDLRSLTLIRSAAPDRSRRQRTEPDERTETRRKRRALRPEARGRSVRTQILVDHLRDDPARSTHPFRGVRRSHWRSTAVARQTQCSSAAWFALRGADRPTMRPWKDIRDDLWTLVVQSTPRMERGVLVSLRMVAGRWGCVKRRAKSLRRNFLPSDSGAAAVRGGAAVGGAPSRGVLSRAAGGSGRGAAGGRETGRAWAATGSGLGTGQCPCARKPRAKRTIPASPAAIPSSQMARMRVRAATAERAIATWMSATACANRS